MTIFNQIHTRNLRGDLFLFGGITLAILFATPCRLRRTLPPERRLADRATALRAAVGAGARPVR